MQLTPDDIWMIRKRMCEKRFAHFVQEAWHIVEPSTPLKWGWMLDALCEHLQAVSEGHIQNLLANVPPGSMKSLLVGVFWPAWEWGPLGVPSRRFLGAAHEQELAVRDNRRCRDVIKSDWFQARWPITLRVDQDGKKDFGNTKQGFRNARAFASMTGARADRVLLDDPISAENANSKAKIKEAERIFNETLPTRINDPQKSSIVVIMQRLNTKDPSGIIIDLDLPYEKFIVPMEFEPERRCVTSIGWKDPRTKAGELMFPERFDEASLVTLKKQLGSYGTAGQLQQRPSPRGGGIIKEAWWQWYTESTRPQINWRRIYVDTAQKDGEEHDYSVLQCWGYTPDGRIVLLDQKRGKWEAPDLERNARTFWNKHREVEGMGALQVMKVEDKVSGTGLIQGLKKRKEDMPALPVKGIPRSTDKVSRAYGVAPQIEAGNVMLPQDAAWVDSYVEEFSDFPAGANDDQCDPTFDAIEDMLLGPSKRPPPAGAPSGVVGPSVVEP